MAKVDEILKVIDKILNLFRRNPYKYINFHCRCGNKMLATVFKGKPYSLTCAKCGKKYEGNA